jgi:hypothetical protein
VRVFANLMEQLAEQQIVVFVTTGNEMRAEFGSSRRDTLQPIRQLMAASNSREDASREIPRLLAEAPTDRAKQRGGLGEDGVANRRQPGILRQVGSLLRQQLSHGHFFDLCERDLPGAQNLLCLRR